MVVYITETSNKLLLVQVDERLHQSRNLLQIPKSSFGVKPFLEDFATGHFNVKGQQIIIGKRLRPVKMGY